MYHYSGNIYIKSVNLSHNKASERSPLSCEPTKINEETNHGSDVLYCSFSNNTVTNQQCIYLYNQYITLHVHMRLKIVISLKTKEQT